jgi:endogenous inhibitor of DNA gyrase (YacG/DUF329 family)
LGQVRDQDERRSLAIPGHWSDGTVCSEGAGGVVFRFDERLDTVRVHLGEALIFYRRVIARPAAKPATQKQRLFGSARCAQIDLSRWLKGFTASKQIKAATKATRSAEWRSDRG